MRIQQLLQQALQITFALTERIWPALAYRWAVTLFVKPMRFKRPQREIALIADAAVRACELTTTHLPTTTTLRYVQYHWADTTSPTRPTVLLVHGWAGRGSQMATFAAPLVAAGYDVITFDAPAHGDAPGERTNLVEVSEIIAQLSHEHGGFAAIIGHSFGGMAAGYALTLGAQTDTLVTIGSPATMELVLADFAQQVHGSPRVTHHIATYIEQLGNQPADHYSLSRSLDGSQQLGLIVHDQEDRDVPVAQAHLLHSAWPGGTLRLTNGLGHRRILRDEATIAHVVAFIAEKADNSSITSELCRKGKQRKWIM